MKQPQINFYLPKAVTDDEVKLITDYCDIHDKSAWTKSDAKQYHLNHNVGKKVNGYGNIDVLLNMSRPTTGGPLIALSFDDFRIILGIDVLKEEPKQESSDSSNNKLTIKNIEKVLLKYIGEQESDDIINELKQLS